MNQKTLDKLTAAGCTAEEIQVADQYVTRVRGLRIAASDDGISVLIPRRDGSYSEVCADSQGAVNVTLHSVQPAVALTGALVLSGINALPFLYGILAGSFLDSSPARERTGDLLREFIGVRTAEGTPTELFAQRSSCAWHALRGVVQTWAETRKKAAGASKADKGEIKEQIGPAIDNRLTAILESLERGEAIRIGERTFQPPTLRYRGVWQAADTYRRGDFASRAGGLWHCNTTETREVPGNGTSDWSLAVKSGDK